MRGTTIEPGRPGSLPSRGVEDVRMDSGLLAVRTLPIGVCGTDRELFGGLEKQPHEGKTVLAIED